MTWGHTSFPRAILHVDGDGFFAACEVAKNPRLRGKPVITGKERGIVSACTYEAKARGVKRGMRLHEVRAVCPDAVILPSDYETYSIFSHRMFEIVRRYTPVVEEYSIDECFAELTGVRRIHRMSYEQLAKSIQRDLTQELGMTFSLGLSSTKVLAKIGSKWQKPRGCTLIPLSTAEQFLAKTPIGAVWGIGPSTAGLLHARGVRTAADFVSRSEQWVHSLVPKPIQEIWRELQGEVVYELQTEGRESYQSISKTKTFTPPSANIHFIGAQLSKNIENACIKARRWNLASAKILFFLKTQEFTYHACEVRLPHPTNVPHDILRAVRAHVGATYKKGVLYRATGVTLLELQDAGRIQLDLFGATQATEVLQTVYAHVDDICKKYGKHTLFLGSSFEAMRRAAHDGERGDVAERSLSLFKGETKRKRLGVASLGEV